MSAEVVSWSKDSIFVRWNFDDDQQQMEVDENDNVSVGGGGGYMVSYQAVGSSIRQVRARQ